MRWSHRAELEVGSCPRQASHTTRLGEPTERIEVWEAQQAEGLARAKTTLDEIGALENFDLATLFVALRTIRTLVQQGAKLIV